MAHQYMENGKIGDTLKGKVQAFNFKAKNPFELDADGKVWFSIGEGIGSDLSEEVFDSSATKQIAIDTKSALMDYITRLNDDIPKANIWDDDAIEYMGNGVVHVVDNITGDLFSTDDISQLEEYNDFFEGHGKEVLEKAQLLWSLSQQLQKIFKEDTKPHEYQDTDDIATWLKNQNLYDAAIIQNVDDGFDKTIYGDDILLKYPQQQIVNSHTVESKTGTVYNEKEDEENKLLKEQKEAIIKAHSSAVAKMEAAKKKVEEAKLYIQMHQLEKF